MLGLRLGVDGRAHLGVAEHGLFVVPAQNAVQRGLDARADQQRVTGVIRTKVDAQLLGCAQAVQGLGHGNQRFDIGHAQQAEADRLPGDRVDAVVGAMQGLHHRQRRLCKAFGSSLAILRQGTQWHTAKAPARCPLAGQLRQALLREGLVRRAKLFAARAHAVLGAEFIDPQHGASSWPLGRMLSVVL